MLDRSIVAIPIAVAMLAAPTASAEHVPGPGDKWLFTGAPNEFLSALLVLTVSTHETCGPLALVEVHETDGSGAVRFWLSRSALTASVSRRLESNAEVGPPKPGFTWGSLDWPAKPPARCPAGESAAEALRTWDALRKVSRMPPNTALQLTANSPFHLEFGSLLAFNLGGSAAFGGAVGRS